MKPVFDITAKDLMQMLRDRKTFMFLLIMPIAFTLLFGYALNGSDSAQSDPRLPVAFVNEDGASPLSLELERFLGSSQVIRLDRREDSAGLEQELSGEDLAAALIIPAGYDAALRSGAPLKLVVLSSPAAQSAAQSARTEIEASAGRLASAVRAARAIAPQGGSDFDSALEQTLAAWSNPPVKLVETNQPAGAGEPAGTSEPGEANRFAQSSPGMILQFAVAGLLTCAQVIVSERKNRCLQRLITTSASRAQILLGHYLAIFLLILFQFAILIGFGQIALGLNYLAQPLATLLIALTAALCIAALGLLIGALARGEEQAISFSMIFMFLLAGLGGAWVPLEATGEIFQAIGRMSPLAWAMDGFQNVLIRGLGASMALLPAAALLGYAALFFLLACWRFKFE